MNTAQTVKKFLKNGLKSEQSKIIILRGTWGVGKTHLWREVIKDYFKGENNSNRKYSYVSLFGLNTFDEFKFQISLKTQKDNGSSQLSENLKSYTSEIFNTFNDAAKGFVPVSIPFEKIAINNQKNLIICLDDLERRADSLRLKDILGYASFLKEERNCHVVIICNDKVEGMDDLTKYSEKIADISVLYNPSVLEVFDIGFEGCESEFQNHFKKAVMGLGVKNIRTLFKIKMYINQFLAVKGVNDFRLVHPFIFESLTLLAWSHYESGSDESIPPLNFFLKDSDSHSNDEKNKFKKQNWKERFDLNYLTGEKELDNQLVNFVEHGFISDESKLISSIQKFHSKKYSWASEESFTSCFDLFYYSFQSNQGEIVTKIKESCEQYATDIRVDYINQAVGLLRDLGDDTNATEIIDLYIQKRLDKKLDIQPPSSFSMNNDAELVKKIEDLKSKEKLKNLKINLDQFIDTFLAKKGFSNDDIQYLNNINLDDLVTYLKNTKYDNSKRIDFVRKVLSFIESTGPDTTELNAAIDLFQSALCVVAKESPLNELRVQIMFKVTCDKP